MTELNDGISVTNQRISRNSGESLYFYVDLQDELAEFVWTHGVEMETANFILLTSTTLHDDWGWIDDGWLIEETGKVRAGRLEDKTSQTILTIKEMTRQCNYLMLSLEFTTL